MSMFSQLGQIAELMRNPAKIRDMMERMREEVGRVSAEGEAGGGLVRAKFNGHMELLELRIDPEALRDADHEILEELVAAAVRQGIEKTREEVSRVVAGGAAGMPIPGMGAFNPFGFGS